MRLALKKAEQLGVPLIVAGDMHDQKALLRAECVKALIDTFKSAKVRTIVMVGNHCLLHEKGKAHALEFLRDYTEIVDTATHDNALGLHMIPYISDPEEMQGILNTIPKGATIIAHTGVQTAYMGHYQQDKSSLPKEAFADYRVISGHYHRRQDIKCGRPKKGAVGLFSYIGNPYTLNFGEASDPEKGFQVLHSDGSLEFVPTNLRRHIVIEFDLTTNSGTTTEAPFNQNDLIWVKLTGTKSELDAFDKEDWGKGIFKHSNYKLEKIYPEAEKLPETIKPKKDSDILDALIDSIGENDQTKGTLKVLWRALVDDRTK